MWGYPSSIVPLEAQLRCAQSAAGGEGICYFGYRDRGFKSRPHDIVR